MYLWHQPLLPNGWTGLFASTFNIFLRLPLNFVDNTFNWQRPHWLIHKAVTTRVWLLVLLASESGEWLPISKKPCHLYLARPDWRPSCQPGPLSWISIQLGVKRGVSFLNRQVKESLTTHNHRYLCYVCREGFHGRAKSWAEGRQSATSCADPKPSWIEGRDTIAKSNYKFSRLAAIISGMEDS